MLSVRVAPTVPELGIVGEKTFQALVTELQYAGFDASLETSRDRTEKRDMSVFVPAAHDVAMLVEGVIVERSLTTLAKMAIQHLRGKRKTTTQGVIYGPDGTVLHRFEIPGEDNERPAND